MYLYRCEDTLESIFTAIYNVYEDRRSREEVLLALDEEPRLFAVECSVEPSEEKYRKVMRTLVHRFGRENYRWLCMALASQDTQKAQAVYVTVARGMDRGCLAGHLFDELANPYVNKAFSLARNADREYSHFRGFVRFEELASGILYGEFRPGNHVLPYLMEHFADRFPEEHFILHDTGRGIWGLHKARERAGEQGSWCLLQGADLGETARNLSADEIKYRTLFKRFCQSIAIEKRRNPKLQQNMLPLHFREYMTEFMQQEETGKRIQDSV